MAPCWKNSQQQQLYIDKITDRMKKTPMILVLIDKKTFYNFVTGETKKIIQKCCANNIFNVPSFCVCV